MGVVGHLTGRQLATGGYRIAEDEADHAPGRNWWPGGRAGAARRAGGRGRSATWRGWAALPAYLLFAWLTVGLIWIDLDVHRLPVGLVVPTGWWLVALLAVAPRSPPADRRWLGALIGAGRDGGGLPAARRAARRWASAVATCGSRRSSGRCSAGWGRGRSWSGLLAGLPRRRRSAAVTLLALRRAGLRSRRSPTARRCAWGRGSASRSTSRILTWLRAAERPRGRIAPCCAG